MNAGAGDGDGCAAIARVRRGAVPSALDSKGNGYRTVAAGWVGKMGLAGGFEKRVIGRGGVSRRGVDLRVAHADGAIAAALLGEVEGLVGEFDHAGAAVFQVVGDADA